MSRHRPMDANSRKLHRQRLRLIELSTTCCYWGSTLMGVPATMMTAAPVIEVGLMAAVLKMLMKAAKIEVSLPTTVGATIEVS